MKTMWIVVGLFDGVITIAKGIISNRRIDEQDLLGRGQQKLQLLLSQTLILHPLALH